MAVSVTPVSVRTNRLAIGRETWDGQPPPHHRVVCASGVA